MRLLLIIVILVLSVPLFAAQTTVTKPKMMTLREQGWDQGAKEGSANSGKAGWFFAGFGNLPLLWLPWAIEPRHPAKPSMLAEPDYNEGFVRGYRAGWRNAHKTYYIAGAVVETAVVGGILLANRK